MELIDFSKCELHTIGNSAFEYCYNLKDVRFSETISLIERVAFWRCKNLSNINSLPHKEIAIANNAFKGCPIMDFNHQSIQIKNGLVIKENCITSCTTTHSHFNVKVPESVDTIQNGAISSDDIIELHIGEGIKTIKPESIMCESLLLLTLPSSLKKLSENAFGEECIPPVIINSSNIKIHFNGTTVINYDENIKYSVRDKKFVIKIDKDKITLVYACLDYSHYEIEVPVDVTNIAYDAFRNCDGHYITLPDSIIPDTVPEYSFEEQECVCGGCKFMLPSGAKIHRYFQ